ncbi:MAG: cold shock domain-containing protein, partial [Chloroflexi bacterium]
LPGMRDYDSTRIREEYGERWFCTEQEAIEAGWRRAGR